MAKELLPEQELGDGRYVVIRVQSFSEEGGLYTVRRVEDKTRWALKEIIPRPGTTDKDLWGRVERLKEAVELLSRFDHPHLSRIVEHFTEGKRQYVVMEWVDGITLEKLMEMSVKPQPEEQCMQWGLDLCAALRYMHDRPHPYIFEVLELSHIMFNPEDNKLKLINYGLDRFILADEDAGLGIHATAVAQEVAKFARVMVLLLTKKEPGPFGLTQQDPVSPKLAQVLNRALAGDPRKGFNNFDDVTTAIDRVLHPPVQQEVVRRSIFFSRWIRWDLHLSRLWELFLWNFFRQPLYVVGLELVGGVIMLVGLYRVTHPPLLPRTGRAVYVACQNRIDVIKAGEKTMLTRIPLEFEVARLVVTPDQSKLYASVPSGNQLLIFNTGSNHQVGFTRVDNGPGPMIMSARGLLAVLHPGVGGLDLVLPDPKPAALEREDQKGRSQDRVVAAAQVGPGASEIFLSDPKVEDAEGTSPERNVQVYVANQKQSDLSLWSPDAKLLQQVAASNQTTMVPMKVEISQFTDGPRTLAMAAKALVAAANRGTIQAFDPKTLKEGEMGTQVGGQEPRQLMFSPKGDEFWCLNASGSLGILAWPALELRQTVDLGGKPSQAALIKQGDEVELWIALENTGEVVVVSPSGRRVDKRIKVDGRPTGLCVVD